MPDELALFELTEAEKAAAAVGAKRCTQCHEVQSLNRYPPNTRRPDGRGSYCLACSRGRARETRGVAPELARLDPPPGAPCEGCGQVVPLYLDHCHSTGRFRGWLCGRCNMTLGGVGDDPALLDALAAYLRMSSL